MRARRATASIETAWNPSSATSRFVTSRICSRRAPALRRVTSGYTTVGYGRRRRDHRQRFLGTGHGHPAAPPRPGRLRRARARQRRRGHLALQHVPGLRLRRALAPVLVLVRAEPGLERDVLVA